MERHRTLEINYISARDLNKVNLMTKMTVYAMVSIFAGDKELNHQKTKTPIDRDGDTNPTWNNLTIKFEVEEREPELTLDFKLVCERALGDKDIGEVHVPVKELLDESLTTGKHLQFASYQVTKPNGQPKGQLTFSYKTGGAGKLEVEPVTEYAPVGLGPSFLYPPPPSAAGVSVYPPYPAGQETDTPGGYPPPPAYGYPPPPAYGYPPPLSYAGYPQPGHGYSYAPLPAGYTGFTAGMQLPPENNNASGRYDLLFIDSRFDFSCR